MTLQTCKHIFTFILKHSNLSCSEIFFVCLVWTHKYTPIYTQNIDAMSFGLYVDLLKCELIDEENREN